MTTCKHCQRTVKLNEIVRSAHHDLGCVNCYGKPEGESAVMFIEKIAARPIADAVTLATQTLEQRRGRS